MKIESLRIIASQKSLYADWNVEPDSISKKEVSHVFKTEKHSREWGNHFLFVAKIILFYSKWIAFFPEQLHVFSLTTSQ